MSLSRAAMRRVAFNFAWSAIYNVLAILLAAGAFVSTAAGSGGGLQVRIPPALPGSGSRQRAASRPGRRASTVGTPGLLVASLFPGGSPQTPGLASLGVGPIIRTTTSSEAEAGGLGGTPRKKKKKDSIRLENGGIQLGHSPHTKPAP